MCAYIAVTVHLPQLPPRRLPTLLIAIIVMSLLDYTVSNAATLHSQNYLWSGTSSTCFVWSRQPVQTQYQHCCVQTCSAESDCPTSCYCQSGWNVTGGSVCTKLDACSTTQNTKCQEDKAVPILLLPQSYTAFFVTASRLMGACFPCSCAGP